jgi:hypothetical protein
MALADGLEPPGLPLCEVEACGAVASWAQWPWCDRHRQEKWAADVLENAEADSSLFAPIPRL